MSVKGFNRISGGNWKSQFSGALQGVSGEFKTVPGRRFSDSHGGTVDLKGV